MNNNIIINRCTWTEPCDTYLKCCIGYALRYAYDTCNQIDGININEMTIYNKNIYNTNLHLFKHYDLLISDYIYTKPINNVTDISLYFYSLLNKNQIKKILSADEYNNYCKQLQYWLILSYELNNNQMSLYLLFEYYFKHDKYNNALIYFKKLKKTNIIIIHKYSSFMNKLEEQNALNVINRFLINLLYKPNIGIYYKRGLKQWDKFAHKFNILCN